MGVILDFSNKQNEKCTNEQIEQFKNINSMILKTFYSYNEKEITEIERIYKKEYDKITNEIINNDFFSKEEMSQFLNDLTFFLDKDSLYDEENIDVIPLIIYVNTVKFSRKKILSQTKELKSLVVNICYNDKLQISYYKMLLNVFLDKNIANEVNNLPLDDHKRIRMCEPLVDEILFDKDLPSNIEIARDFFEDLKKYLRKKENRKINDNCLFADDENSFTTIYETIKESMNSFDALDKRYFSDEDYQTLEKIYEVKNIILSKRHEFIDTIHIIDKNNNGLLKKIEQMLLLITVYASFDKENIIEFNIPKSSRK